MKVQIMWGMRWTLVSFFISTMGFSDSASVEVVVASDLLHEKLTCSDSGDEQSVLLSSQYQMAGDDGAVQDYYQHLFRQVWESFSHKFTDTPNFSRLFSKPRSYQRMDPLGLRILANHKRENYNFSELCEGFKENFKRAKPIARLTLSRQKRDPQYNCDKKCVQRSDYKLDFSFAIHDRYGLRIETSLPTYLLNSMLMQDLDEKMCEGLVVPDCPPAWD